MNKTSLKTYLLAGAAALAVLSPIHANAADDLEQALIKDGEFFGEVRYRYENVEQDSFANDANASTVRTNIGFKTGIYQGFQALIEGQIVQDIGGDEFNSTTNGETTYPVVADPNVAEINELWFAYSAIPDTIVKAGRQKVNIDNQRFVGTVGWRQNDQTFDGAAVINSSITGLDLMYAYVQNVNRIQGDDHALGDLDTNTHIAHASYQATDWLNITGYGYWIDIDRASTLSSKTYGLRLTGKAPINDAWTFFYEAEAAAQKEHGNNTANYDEKYYHITPGIKGHGFTFKVGYEELGGNGTNSFQTPLATAHKFNGWADAFLATPAAGLEDAYVSASYQLSDTDTMFDGTKFTATYHDFDSDDSSSGDFGDELDLSIGKSFTLPDAGQPFEKIDVLLKYADYDGDSGVASREKFWLQVGVKF